MTEIPTCGHVHRVLYPITRRDSATGHWTPRSYCAACCGPAFVERGEEISLALHRIVTGLNERTVWEHLAAGKPLADLLTPLPEEFHAWTGEVVARLLATVESKAAEVESAYSTILASLPTGFTRKQFALKAVESEYKWALFAKLDGKDYRAGLWDSVKPEPFLGPRRLAPTEATA